MLADCRLYVVTPPRLPDDFAATLGAALDAGDVAAVRLHLAPAESAGLRKAVEMLRPVVQSRNVALILAGEASLATAARCDGVHLHGTDMPTSDARRLIGDLQLGVFCAASRDAAMIAGEQGADYVAFDPFLPDGEIDTELVAWWHALMELPVVVEGPITQENCGALVQAGADFLAVGEAIWHHPAGPAAAVRAFNAAIQQAAGEMP